MLCPPPMSLESRSAECSVEWLRFGQFSAATLYEALAFRQRVFVVEQASPYGDLDGRDEAALHLLMRSADGLVGYLRLLPPDGEGGHVAIGRVAVAAERRGTGLGRRLVAEGLGFAERSYPGHEVMVSAQDYLRPFYASLGFIAVSPPYDDFGVAHVDMARPARAGPR